MKKSKALTFATSAGLLLAAQTSVQAHIIIEDMKGREGYNEMLPHIVPHGCGG